MECFSIKIRKEKCREIRIGFPAFFFCIYLLVHLIHFIKLPHQFVIISGISVGAGEVAITKINGYKFNINGDYDTLVLIYKDKPGMVYRVTALLQGQNLNIASMHCDRNAKGQEASMGICLDGHITDHIMQELAKIEGVYLIRNIEMLKK